MKFAIPTDTQTTINGYKITLEFSEDEPYYFGSCQVEKGDYCSSLGRLYDEGTLVNSDDDEITLPDRLIHKIEAWAEANGY